MSTRTVLEDGREMLTRKATPSAKSGVALEREVVLLPEDLLS
jgi:hypothetical protein